MQDENGQISCLKTMPNIFAVSPECHRPHKHYLIHSTDIQVGNQSVMISGINSLRNFLGNDYRLGNKLYSGSFVDNLGNLSKKVGKHISRVIML